MKAVDIANYFIYLLSDDCEDLTNMKLNKLLYYAQGHHLQMFGKKLFNDPIEAWNHGPVVESVYRTYKSSGNKPIDKYDKEKALSLSKETRDFLMKVALEYSKYTASTLRGMSHAHESPWDCVFEEGRQNVVIPEELIKNYFIAHEKVLNDIELSFKDGKTIEERDSEGYLVLPKAWDE